MRRLAATALALVALAAGPASAAPARLTDPKGDWAVPSQDVVSARLYSALSGKTPVLRGELRLAEAPSAAVPSSYAVGFSVGGCQDYTFSYEWLPNGYTANLTHTDFCGTRPDPDLEPDDVLPATATVRGTTIVWESRYTGHVKRGAVVDGMYGGSCPKVCVIVGGTEFNGEKTVGDFAFGRVRYVVGSDLPRK